MLLLLAAGCCCPTNQLAVVVVSVLLLQSILGRIARVDYMIPPEFEKSPELRDLVW